MLNTTNTFTFTLANHHTSSIFAPMVCSCCHKSESYIPFEHIWLWPCVEVYYPSHWIQMYPRTQICQYPTMFKCMIFLFRTFEYKTGNVLPVVALRRSCWVYNWVKKILKSWFNSWENCWLHSPLAEPLFLSPAYPTYRIRQDPSFCSFSSVTLRVPPLYLGNQAW